MGRINALTGSNLMYFVATCMMALKKGVTSAGILNTIDSKALERFKQNEESKANEKFTCNAPSRSSSSSWSTTRWIPGTIAPRPEASRCGDARTIAATRLTVVLRFSIGADVCKLGMTTAESNCPDSSGADRGTKCERVTIARFRTAGRPWVSKGVMV